ncbi:OLC1v1014200C1 [Oldenlandia corymbosa var. corymbosa]|uniref:OLC1v1014200C1 n=1 Tax=Oldenlandia corymbosa var. corymbosa TaxID=529605 RepID=A0AAV1E039_OLDCO|nr:OLC1v1014200C1 [Oldenlandia corymbosa var. corymbosa]
MNRCAYQHQNHHQQKTGFVGLGFAGEMMRRGDSYINSSASMAACPAPNGVVCPKPRRLVNVNEPINIRPSRVVHTTNNHYQLEACESRAGTELLDLILAKGNNYGAERSSFQVASSPPFYNGSPPVRASNPVIQDEQFGIGKMMMSPLSPSMEALAKSGSGGSSSGRVKCGNKPAPVRIEGFECRGTAVVA